MTDAESGSGDITLQEKARALLSVAAYRPLLTTGIVGLSVFAALLEGIGLSFLIPIIEIAQGSGETGDMSAIGRAFVAVYDILSVPFTLEFVIVGVTVVMAIRYTSSFLVAWLRAALQTDYIRHLQSGAFDRALDARVAYYDEHGSDEILNAIVTQAEYAGQLIQQIVKIVEQSALSLMYLVVALYLAPRLTLLTGVVLGGFFYGLRYLMESGYSVGDRVADANEKVQRNVQAGTQGIREVKLFGVAGELYDEFQRAVNQFVGSLVKLQRNRAVIENTYQLVTAVTVFVVIYAALRFASLSLAGLGLFLFAMFRLAPRLSNLNNVAYHAAGNLPHLVRTQAFIDGLESEREVDDGIESPPTPVERVVFENVSFAYQDEQVLNGLTFEVERGEFVAFVGPSGTGKSTIVSLLARFYDPDSGQIVAHGIPIERFVLEKWRSKVAVVRQQPFLFNDTVRYNVTLGDREASEAAIREACEIAQVTEFLDDLPDGLDTVLGDDGVRLSGGQRQRVAIARALLKPADVLVLDEATSDLDTALEERVHEGIEELTDYAMIVIAHRLSTVTDADRIYAMEGGEIVEEGTHADLLENKGPYTELYSKQIE